MAWVQLFPTNATRISQSVAQIQANWLFIQQNINFDHSFDTGAPTEGHHKFVHLPTQGADIALILTGAIYQKNNVAGNPRLFYRNASAVHQIPTATNGTLAYGVAAGYFTVLNMAGQHACHGIFMASSTAQVNNRMAAFVTWDGAALMVTPMIYIPPYPAPAGTYDDIRGNGTNIQISKVAGFAATVQWSFIKIER